MSTPPAREGVKPESPWPLIVLIGSVIVLWFASAAIIDKSMPAEAGTDVHARRGQFGDKFGAINSLFSGLAFACLVYATFLQRRELALQREELGLTRKELELTRQETAAQTALFAQQLKTMQDSHLASEDAFFICESASHSGSTQVVYHFRNSGQPVYDVVIEAPEGIKVDPVPPEQLSTNMKFDLGFSAHGEREKLAALFGFRIKYNTKSGRRRSANFGGRSESLPVLFEMEDL